MRTFGHLSGDEKLCGVFIRGAQLEGDEKKLYDVHSMTASEMFSRPIHDVEKWQRSAAKQCIAEGQLVLTDQGLIPIEKITLQHKLWDGVEWVSHQGVVDQGIREVIEYDGLTATPDHKVVTAAGRSGTILAFGEAASAMARLHRTGDEGKAIRTCYRNLVETSARERIRRSQGEVLEMRRGVLEVERQFTQKRCKELPTMQSHKVQASARPR
jgi:DNA polymerase